MPEASERDSGPKPQNVVVLLLDSLNRHFLSCYLDETEQRARRVATGVGAWADIEPVATPNLDRLAARSLRFDQHWSGSLPCMPARHDVLVGALDFLWRPWGSIEVWEDAVTHLCGTSTPGSVRMRETRYCDIDLSRDEPRTTSTTRLAKRTRLI